MHASSRIRKLVPFWLAALLAAGTAGAQTLRDLVEQVLDQQIEDVSIEGVPLPEALARLGDQTGLVFVMDRAVMDAMPYGEQTRVSIDLRDLPIRQALRRAFDGLGLSMRVEEDRLYVEPSPVLERLGRRMTIEEVRRLGELAGRRWSELPAERHTVRFQGLPQPDAQAVLETALAGAPGDNALQQLEAATRSHGWCWVPQGGELVVYPRSEDVRRRLERTVDLDYRGVPLEQVLVDLGQRVGVTMSFQTGVLERLLASQRKVDLVHRGTTVRQTLERLCGSTGISYDLAADAVVISLPGAAPGGARVPSGRVVAILRVPVGEDGTAVEFPFYEDNLPEEFSRLLEHKLPLVLEELRRRGGR